MIFHHRPSKVALTLGGFLLLWGQASSACSVHDHGCVYHSFNSPVTLSSPLAAGSGTSLVIYAIGTNNNQPSTIDFDNKVLLPSMTGDRVLTNSYTQPTGPYIVSSTAYGATHPPPTWKTAGDGALQVYPSQYQVVFNQNTAVAKHTGDLNGGENGNIPGATGCPNMPGKANCEAVVVTGNAPNGVYEQKVRIFNFFNVPNPTVEIQLGAYTTGQAILISNSHVPSKSGGHEVSDNIQLQGNGAISDTYSYEFYNRGFDPHAAGVAGFDRSKSRISKYKPFVSGDHAYQDWYRTTDTLNTKVWGDGWSEQTSSQQVSYLGRHDLGVIHKVASSPLPTLTNFSFKDCPIAPCADQVYQAPTVLPKDPVSDLLSFVRVNPHKIPDASSALIPATLTQYVDDRSIWQKIADTPAKILNDIQERDRRSRVFNEPLINPVNVYVGGTIGIIKTPLAAASLAARVLGSTDYIGEPNSIADTLDSWNNSFGNLLKKNVAITFGGANDPYAYDPNSTASNISEFVAPATLFVKPSQLIGGKTVTRMPAGEVAAGVTSITKNETLIAKRFGTSTDDLAKAAAVEDRGSMTAAGRALQKHGVRGGSVFPNPRGNPSSINEQAELIVESILNDPARVVTQSNKARFGLVTDIFAPGGRGLRYDADGKFIGFLEPP